VPSSVHLPFFFFPLWGSRARESWSAMRDHAMNRLVGPLLFDVSLFLLSPPFLLRRGIMTPWDKSVGGVLGFRSLLFLFLRKRYTKPQREAMCFLSFFFSFPFFFFFFLRSESDPTGSRSGNLRSLPRLPRRRWLDPFLPLFFFLFFSHCNGNPATHAASSRNGTLHREGHPVSDPRFSRKHGIISHRKIRDIVRGNNDNTLRSLSKKLPSSVRRSWLPFPFPPFSFSSFFFLSPFFFLFFFHSRRGPEYFVWK